jgi:AraC-like DNA-binding protein
VGVSPKQFLMITRFGRLIRCLEDLPEQPEWTDMAHRHGYYDQPHLISEVRAATTLSPRDFTRSERCRITDHLLVPPTS